MELSRAMTEKQMRARRKLNGITDEFWRHIDRCPVCTAWQENNPFKGVEPVASPECGCGLNHQAAFIAAGTYYEIECEEDEPVLVRLVCTNDAWKS